MAPPRAARRSTTARRPARASRALSSVCALAGFALLGCDTTALRLLVVAELAVPEDTNELVVTVTADDEEASSRYRLEESSSSLRESLTLLPGERMRSEVHVAVDAVKGAVVVASGSMDGAFREGGVEELIVTLSPPQPPRDGGPPNDDAGTPPEDAGPRQCDDPDGDGYGDGPDCTGLDCDESDADVHVGAEELCNEIDDDCDAAIDEGCDCELADNRICGSIVGECRYGYQVCMSGAWSDCTNATLPVQEICDNNDDDDCDGDTDEGCE